jgi:hypothetical protein
MTEYQLESCPACGAKAGERHQLGCDVEQCPECGRQLLSCIHYMFGAVEPPPDEERLPWPGVWPGVQACRELGWWSKPSPEGTGYAPCGPDEPGAEPDVNRLFKQAVWDRRRKRWLRREDLGSGARLVLRLWLADQAAGAESLAEVVDELQGALDRLRRMQTQGVVLAEDSDLEHGYAVLVTTKPGLASQFDFALEERGEAEGPGQP